MTRIYNNIKSPPPVGPSGPETIETARTSVTESLSARELFRLIQVSLAPSPDRAMDLDAISQVVIDWWMREKLPAHVWKEPVRRQLREHLIEVLRGDPAFQSMVQKLSRERER